MAPAAAPQRLLLCPVCPFSNKFATADALEVHLAMGHYPECLPYPCITGCQGTVRFPTERILRRHSREEHGLVNYEVSFQPRTENERFQVGRIRAQLRSALADSNQDGSDDEGDVKFLGASTFEAATNTAMGGMNNEGSIALTTSAPTCVLAPQPLGDSATATSAAPNVIQEVNVGGMSNWRTTASYSSGQIRGWPEKNELSSPSSSSAAAASATTSPTTSRQTPVASYSNRCDRRPGNNAAVGTSTGRQGQTTKAATTELPPPQSPSQPSSAATSASGRPQGAGIGSGVHGGPAASNSSGAPSSRFQRRTQPPSIESDLARRLQRSLTALAAKGRSARCTCGVLLSPSCKRQLGRLKMQHVNSHLQIPLFECCLCSFTSTGYNHDNFYGHLRRRHPHLRGAPIEELVYHCISHMNEEIAERLRRGLERYFASVNRTRGG